MTATLHALPVPGLANIPQLLRNIADELEAGDFGQVAEGVVVLGGESLEVFGLGGADGTVTHYLLARAQRKLERIDLL